MGEPPDVDATVRRIESLVEELEQADPWLRRRAEEVIRLLLQLYGTGFSRAIEILGREQASRIAEDKLVASLLLLHGLHPAVASERVAEALRRIELRLDGHRLHLVGIADDVAHVRFERNGGAVPPSLAAVIEEAIAESAPDIARVEIEAIPEPATALVQIAASVYPTVSR